MVSDAEIKLIKTFVVAESFAPNQLQRVATMSPREFFLLQYTIMGSIYKPNQNYGKFLQFTIEAYKRLLRPNSLPDINQHRAHMAAQIAQMSSMITEIAPEHLATSKILGIETLIDGRKMGLACLCQHCLHTVHALQQDINDKDFYEAIARIVNPIPERISPTDQIEVCI